MAGHGRHHHCRPARCLWTSSQARLFSTKSACSKTLRTSWESALMLSREPGSSLVTAAREGPLGRRAPAAPCWTGGRRPAWRHRGQAPRRGHRRPGRVMPQDVDCHRHYCCDWRTAGAAPAITSLASLSRSRRRRTKPVMLERFSATARTMRLAAGLRRPLASAAFRPQRNPGCHARCRAEVRGDAAGTRRIGARSP
jgi:hypothetical protein